MASFRFRYERILRLALQRERQQAYRVGQIMAEIVAQKRKIKSLSEEWARAREEWLGEVNRGARAVDLEAGIGWLAALQAKIDTERAELDRLQSQLAEERARLADLVKRRRIYEKLKERDRERFEARQRRIEQAFIDEVASISDWRSKAESRHEASSADVV